MEQQIIEAIAYLSGSVLVVLTMCVIIVYITCYAWKSLFDGIIFREISQYRKDKIEYLERKQKLKESKTKENNQEYIEKNKK